MKKTMNMKKTFAAILAASMAASAASVADNQDLIESKVDSINAKRGLEVTGSIRAVAQSASIDTDNDASALNKLPNTEKNEFVSADLNFGFRPFENVRANATLRLAGGMQEYFAAAAKSVSVPWLNVEGNLGKDFYWVVGDFRQQYSPLTLFMPGVEIMYEPQIFARKRYMAEKQQMLDGNMRNLQGANLQFRHELGDALGEIRTEALFARLARTSVLDLTGAEGNILPSDTAFGASQASNMDKWVFAGNLEWLPFNHNTYVGATAMLIFDNEDSYSYTYRRPGNDYSKSYELQSINPYDVNPQSTSVMSGRVGVDIAGMMANKNLILDATAEFALSSDDVYKADSSWALEYDEETGLPTGSFAVNDDGNPFLALDSFKQETLDGVALLINANAGYKTESWSVKLAVDAVYNDSSWYNNLAQSGSFFAQRILNSDIDGQTVKYGVNSPLYSSFDALYNFAPKFAPVATVKGFGTDDNAFKDSPAKSYNIAPYSKNSYTSNVFTRTQLALLETLADPALQLALPNGLATSNRLGGRANLIVGVGDAAEVQGLFSIFQQVSPVSQVIDDHMGNVMTLNFKEATYMEFGGGAKVDIFKLLGFSKPLEISGSYKHSERSVDTDGWEAIGLEDATSELKSDFINAGLYVQYLPRLGVNFGFQMINTEYNDFAQQQSAFSTPLMKGEQMQWMVGLDYNIAKHAWLAVNVGTVSVSNEYNVGSMINYYDNAYNTTYAAEYDKAAKKFADPANPTAEEVAAATASAKDKASAAGLKATKDNASANMPNYYEYDGTETYKHEFSQFVLEASLNVEF